jgi:hypothetical protein
MEPVSVMSLWLPILLSAVIVFVASSVIHMALGYHAGDFASVPREDDVMAALRPFSLAPGDYCVPRPSSMKDMQSPAFQEKLAKGPVLFFTVRPSGSASMTASLVQWFLFSVVISVFAAYLTSRSLSGAAGVEYLTVFRLAGTTAFLGYAMAYVPQSIWYGRSWRTTGLNVLDGFVYGLLTAGTFAWLWPR